MASTSFTQKSLTSEMERLTLNEIPSFILEEKDKCFRYYEMETWEERIGMLFENREFADVAFILMRGRDLTCRIAAHRLVLAGKSPVFFEMFCEQGFIGRQEIYLNDVEPDDFEQVLRFLYGKDVKIESTTQAKKVMELAEKCGLPVLVEYCRPLSTSVDARNALMVFQESVLNEVPELILKSLLFIANEAEGVLATSIPDGILPQILGILLKVHNSYGFNIRSEVKVLERVIEWGKRWNPDNGGADVYPLLPYIHFSQITLEELNKVAADILISEETRWISAQFPNAAHQSPLGKQGTEEALTRCALLKCFASSLGNASPFGLVNVERTPLQVKSISVRFKAKKGMFLSSYGLDPCILCRQRLPCSGLRLLKGNVSVKVGNMFIKRFNDFPFDKSRSSFEPPIAVNAGEWCRISLKFDEGSPRMYSCKSLLLRSSKDMDFLDQFNGSEMETWCIFRNVQYATINI